MDKKTILKRLENLKKDTERIYTFVSTEVKEAYIESYITGSFNGWKYNIVYDTEDDALSLLGPRSNNSQTIAEYQGIAFCIGSIPAEGSLDDETVVSDDFIKSMEEEYQKELLKFYEDEYDHKNSSINDMLNDLEADTDYIFKQCFPDAYEELLKDCINTMWDDYEEDNILEKIDTSLEQHIKYLEYEMQTEE